MSGHRTIATSARSRKRARVDDDAAPDDGPAAPICAASTDELGAIPLDAPDNDDDGAYSDSELLPTRRVRFEQRVRRAHPQLNRIDARNRTVLSLNVPLNGAPRVVTPFGVFDTTPRRAPDEQAMASRPINVLSPAAAAPFHGSHSGQHSRSGEPSRVNMHALPGDTNVRIIGAFEREQRALGPDLTGRTLTEDDPTELQGQLVTSTFDPSVVGPRFVPNAARDALAAGDPAQRARAAALGEAAARIPATQRREMFTPGAPAAATLDLGPDQTVGSTAAQPRLSMSYALSAGADARFARAGRPTGLPTEFRTEEDAGQQRQDALLYLHLRRHTPPAYQAASAAALASSVQQGDRFGSDLMDEAARAERVLPSFATGHGGAMEAEALRAGLPPGWEGLGRGVKRKARRPPDDEEEDDP